MKFKKFVAVMTAVIVLGAIFNFREADAASLSDAREQVAGEIADICIEEWPNYGIWPSVAIGQAFVKSGLGVGPNLFGCLGHAGRGTVSATYGYLRVLQNQYFRGEANFASDPESQLAIIMKNGRYCAGEYPYGSYYYKVIRSIDTYGWRKYDKAIKKLIRAKKKKKLRKQRQKEKFHIVFSDEYEEGICLVDPGWVKKGSSIVHPGGVCEATDYQKGLKNTLIIGIGNCLTRNLQNTDKFFNLEEMELSIHVSENAKG